MRLGIHQTDSVLERYLSRHGDYPDMFRALLGKADLSGSLRFEDYAVLHGVVPGRVDECDAYLVTGSRESVYDEREWIAMLSDFIGKVAARRKKLVGICFGHQLIALVLVHCVVARGLRRGVGPWACTRAG